MTLKTSSKLKILIVHEVNYLSKIIYEFQILPEMLSLLGHEVIVVDYDDTWSLDSRPKSLLDLKTRVVERADRAYPNAGVTLHRPGQIRFAATARLSGALTSAYEIARLLRYWRPNAVLLYGVPTVGIQTVGLAQLFNVPVVFRAIDVTHELVPARILIPATRFCEWWVFNHAAFNIALTPHLREYLHSYDVPYSKIRLLPSGVDLGMFSPGPRNDVLMARWGIGTGDPVILFMGTIYRFSGLDSVIADLPKLLKQLPRLKLLIVGGGEDEFRLKELAVTKAVRDSVVFTGVQPYSLLPDIIRSADICINPFELNGVTKNILPTKLFQYMACAKPTVATRLPGTLEFLAGEEQGIAYAMIEDFSSQLLRLLTNGLLRQRIGEQAQKCAGRYDWRGIAEQMAEWLSEARV